MSWLMSLAGWRISFHKLAQLRNRGGPFVLPAIPV
jgi:hypothetical protein